MSWAECKKRSCNTTPCILFSWRHTVVSCSSWRWPVDASRESFSHTFYLHAADCCSLHGGRRISWRHAVIGTVLLFCCSLSGGSGMSPSFMATVTIFFLRFDLMLPVSKTFFVSLRPLFATVQILRKSWYFFSMDLFSLYRWEYTATFLWSTYTDSVYFYLRH